MKRFLPAILFALSLAIFAGCGNQNPNVDAERHVERTIGTLSVMTIENEMNVRFSMTMDVRLRERDERAFDRQYERSAQRIIENIEAIMFASTPEERMDPRLETIREKSQQVINEILGTPWVQLVIITNITMEVN